MREIPLFFIYVLLALPTIFGCGEVSSKVFAKQTFHQKFGWKAEDYFEDPQVIALCKAIEADDLSEIERLVEAGANFNAKGKGNMTPLLWAYPDNKLARFQLLLELGADPNVIIQSDFHTRGGMSAGDSVTHMSCETSFEGYFDAVFRHGGDVNLVNSGPGKLHDTPLFLVIKWGGLNKLSRVKLLIDKGANLNHVNSMTPTMQAVSWGGQYDIALLLLESGADYRAYQENQAQRLVHVVVRQDDVLANYSPRQKAGYEQLVNWLEKHGESLEAARADLKRWASWCCAPEDFKRNMDAEIAERKAREKARLAREKLQQNVDANGEGEKPKN